MHHVQVVNGIKYNTMEIKLDIFVRIMLLKKKILLQKIMNLVNNYYKQVFLNHIFHI